jgi:hypothetical protein
MFDFLKMRERNNGTSSLQMADLDRNPLRPGDMVDALRYDLGKSKVIETEKGLAYESIRTGKVVTWHLMVDAVTELQKVRKIAE